MKKIYRFLLTPILFLLATSHSFSQLTIVDNQTAQQLASMLVGQGITVTNPVLTCSAGGSGKFFGTSNLGMDSGIVLTSGYAKTNGFITGVDAIATNGMSAANAPGDADLNALSGSNTNNACVLEFDFRPTGDTIKFQYVFGSEEYPEFACTQWNDIFAFLISGPGIVSNTPIPTKRNMALIPGTNIPIAINSVNSGVGGGAISYCSNMYPGAPYTQYYVDNLNPVNPHIVFDGMTKVMTAIQGVIPCETYHLKLAVADVGDWSFNSGVFLKAGSLTTTTIQTENTSGGGSNTNNLHSVRGCHPATLRYKRAGCDTLNPFTFHLQFGGTAVNGVDYEFLPDSLVIPALSSTADIKVKAKLRPPTGPLYVTLNVLSPDSLLAGSPIVPIVKRDTVWIYDSLYIKKLSNDTAVCPNNTVTLRAETTPGLNFSWSAAEYNQNVGTITPTVSTTRDFVVSVTQPNAPSTCPPSTRTFHVLVEQYPVINMPSDTIVCIVDSAVIPVRVDPDSVNYLYKWSPATGLRADNIGTNFMKRPPGNYSYLLNVTTPKAKCSSSHTININVITPAKVSVSPPSGTIVPYNSEVTLKASGSYLYTWYPSALFYDPMLPNATTVATETMTYQVVGMDQYGCRDTASVLIKVLMPRDPIMPNAFSPNGDNTNDVFKITNNEFQKLLRFEVYNRYGQIIFTTTDPLKGWDGTYNGKPVDKGVYYYFIVVELPNKQQKTYKGDVTLIR